MAVAPNTVFEVGFKYRANDQICRNFIHFRNGANIPGVDELEVQFQILSQMFVDAAADGVAPFLAVLSDEVTLLETSVQAVFVNRYRKSVSVIGDTGTVAGSCTAQNLQASIQTYGLLANRHNIGGVRIGGLPASAYSEGLIVPGVKTNLETLASVWFTDFQVVIAAANYDFFPCIPYHTKTVIDGKDTFPITGSTQIVGAVVKDEVRTMRRRVLGRGE